MDRIELSSRHLCSATLLPALVPADEIAEPRSRGLLKVLRHRVHQSAQLRSVESIGRLRDLSL